ncbi:hypothetical protein M0805_004761 [Coniferiporia weirii]|nr:hypothetical protein M0805_004761 [Coniferiporia weirii]
MIDILVLGATGFTGKLITRYLHVHRERDSFSFGVAGRSKARLNELAEELGLGAAVPIFEVDVTRDDEVYDAVRHAKVVISAVGPYFRWGMSVVRVCARLGVHYVDINGETPFVHEIISQYDYIATKTRAIIVPSCGFDSIPSDALAFLGARALRAATHGRAGIAQSHTMFSMGGGLSGGTISTALSLLDNIPRSAWRALLDPFVLSPVKGPVRGDRGSHGLVHKLPFVRPVLYGLVTPLAPHNIAIVQRTRGLLAFRARELEVAASKTPTEENSAEAEEAIVYGDAFDYSESTKAWGLISAYLIGFGFALGGACLALFPPLRWLFGKIGTQPGKGPSDEVLEKGFMKVRNVSVSEPIPGLKKPIVVETTVRGRGDPGYTLTAVMVSESALCLLAPERLTPLARNGGVLTPMSALGDTLLRRLAASGRFEFGSEVLESV